MLRAVLKRNRLFVSFALVAVMAGGASLFAAPVIAALPDVQSGQPVDLQAQQLSHDEKAQIVTALGDVEAVQGGQVLRADKVVYNLAEDKISAIGNVSLMDEQGNVYFAEYVELTGNMKDGFVQGLLAMLADGARFTAAESKREGGVTTTMSDASYTPCKVCESNPEPLWQIKADKIVHDAKEKTIKYKNARLEFMDVPVAIAPVFSHADPSVKRKSGFLRPQFGWTDDLGAYAETGYYFGDIAPDKDATLSLRPTTLQGILGQAEWRQRFENGAVKINVSGVNADRKEEDGRVEKDVARGHIFADGLFDINDKWRAGFGVERASDKGYLRLYDISNKDVLENEAYVERFSGRDYSRVSALNFQDVRIGLRPDQADILPSAEHRMIGRPGGLLGGRWTAGMSALGLSRGGEGQDVLRGSVDAGWERRDIMRFGLVTQTNLSARGDFYSVDDRVAAIVDPNLDEESKAARGMAVASLTTSYPLVRRMQRAQIIVEPMVGASLSPQVDDTDNDIPNEDSIDIQLDTNNLFAQNRFPGMDRQEDGARVVYGMKSGVYADDGRYGRVFVGQSYRLDKDNVFPSGSGLEDRSSDIVGQVNVGISKYLNADYRFQMDNQNLAFHRHEVQASGGNETFDVNLGYMYIDDIVGTGFTEVREQVQVGGNYRLTPEWWLNAYTLTDLGEEPGLRKAAMGINYADECFSFGLQGMRNLTYDASGESGTVVLLRVGFKNIGEFSTPIKLERNAEEDLGG